LKKPKKKAVSFTGRTVIDPKRAQNPKTSPTTSYFIISLASIKGKLLLDCVADMKKFEKKNVGGRQSAR
jgi:hypothetical protein